VCVWVCGGGCVYIKDCKLASPERYEILSERVAMSRKEDGIESAERKLLTHVSPFITFGGGDNGGASKGKRRCAHLDYSYANDGECR